MFQMACNNCKCNKDTYPVVYAGYTFKQLKDQSILLDSELDISKIDLKTGDKFEVVIVPGTGILLKKI